MTQEEFHKRYQYNPTTDCLGEGGFGKVYKAYDTHRDRWVAIKMAEVKSGLEQVRLKHEVELINKLPTHPNIAYYEECYTFSTFAGEYDFGVLQYYEQGNLDQLVREKQLTSQQKDHILRQILEGIAFLHSQGIIHRDLKPQNILIANRNGEYIPKITDFGISKKLDVNNSSVFTNSLAGAGTLSFASPEQLLGKTIRKNTDLWSFGVIVCSVYLEKLPFNLSNVSITSEAARIELYKRITNGNLDSSVNQLSTQWYNVVKKCLVVDVLERIENAAKCLELLNEGLSNNTSKLYEFERTQLQRKENEPINVKQIETDHINTITNFSESKRSKNKKYIHLAIYLVSICLILLLCLYVGTERGFWNRGNEVISLKYDDAGSFSEGLAPVKLNGKWGYIDKQDRQVISLKYDLADSFSEGLAPVELNGKWGYIDKQDRQVMECRYDAADSFSEGLALVELNGKWGYIDKQYHQVIECRYDAADSFSEGLARVRIGDFIDGKAGYIDKQGNVVIAFKYAYVGRGSFCEGLAPVKESLADGSYSYIDKQGHKVIDSKYTYAGPFSEGLAIVSINGKCGFIDKKGLEVIACKYDDDVVSFNEGLARIYSNNMVDIIVKGKWYFIDKQGNKVLSYNYDFVGDCCEGLRVVGLNRKYGFISD
jgi:serine/threonine protein kinase